MNADDLIAIYDEKKITYGSNTYKQISVLLKEAKEQHKKDFLKSDTSKTAKKEGRVPDHEQSWRAFKGKNLEKLLEHMMKDCVRDLGLSIINGGALERTSAKHLSDELNRVKRNLLIDYGEYGCHLPDVDLVIYKPKSFKVIAILSSKVTLRERIAQTGYWKLKLSNDSVTKHIKVLFITLDEDSTLTTKTPARKGRAISEIDTDGTYVLTTDNLEESNNVKLFDKFIDDIGKYKKIID